MSKVVSESRWSRAVHALARLRPQRVGLRTRILLTFSFGFLALSVFLATITYTFTRTTLLKQRDRAAVEQTYRDASQALSRLRSQPATAQEALDALAELGIQRPLLNYRGSWTPGDNRFGDNVLPAQLIADVAGSGGGAGGTPSRMIITVEGEQVLVVGVPLPEVNA
ncbi:MAG: hypothetical protein ABIW84_06080, partial [Ilumatobacteraceae bacterium]